MKKSGVKKSFTFIKLFPPRRPSLSKVFSTNIMQVFYIKKKKQINHTFCKNIHTYSFRIDYKILLAICNFCQFLDKFFVFLFFFNLRFGSSFKQDHQHRLTMSYLKFKFETFLESFGKKNYRFLELQKKVIMLKLFKFQILLNVPFYTKRFILRFQFLDY